MAENPEGGSSRGGGGPSQVRPKESLGYRILMAFLWVDVTITIVLVVFLAGSCG